MLRKNFLPLSAKCRLLGACNTAVSPISDTAIHSRRHVGAQHPLQSRRCVSQRAHIADTLSLSWKSLSARATAGHALSPSTECTPLHTRLRWIIRKTNGYSINHASPPKYYPSSLPCGHFALIPHALRSEARRPMKGSKSSLFTAISIRRAFPWTCLFFSKQTQHSYTLNAVGVVFTVNKNMELLMNVNGQSSVTP